MAIWPFNRKKQDDTLPEEVKEFYESGRKERSGMAWLMALGTLIVTVVLALLLFYGGRWVYNKLAGNDEPENQPTETSEQTQQQQTSSNDNNNQPPSANNNSNPSNQQGSSSTNTNQPSTPQPSQTQPNNTPSQSNTPSTGSSSPEVPDTGPGPGGLQ